MSELRTIILLVCCFLAAGLTILGAVITFGLIDMIPSSKGIGPLLVGAVIVLLCLFGLRRR